MDENMTRQGMKAGLNTMIESLRTLETSIRNQRLDCMQELKRLNVEEYEALSGIAHLKQVEEL